MTALATPPPDLVLVTPVVEREMPVPELPQSRVATVPTPRPVSSWRRRYLTAALGIDLVAGLLGSTAGLLRFADGGPGPIYLTLAAVLPGVWLLSLALGRAYESRFLYVGNDEYRRVVNAGLWLTVIVVLASYAVRFPLARGYAALSLTLMTGLTLFGRFLLRKRLHHYRAQGRCMHPVLVMGYERAVAGLCRQLDRMPQHGMQVVGALLPVERIHPNALNDVGVPVLGGFDDAARAVAESGADTVAVLACPELDGIALRRLAWQLEKSGTDLVVAPALIDAAGSRTTIRPIDGLPMLHVEHPDLTGVRRLAKAAMDRLLAALLLVLGAPVLLGIAVAVRLDSAGGAFFRQVRVGQDGTPFVLHKFRTMRADAEDALAALMGLSDGDGILFKMREDPRITRVGRFLRRYSIDELPQLWNVLTGRMSLVGPRPPLPSEVAQYLH
nr:exopolysaccharide biosynthesis polyprenyl glycosylphosphotransferase [Geodermatophilaceae bacterium]